LIHDAHQWAVEETKVLDDRDREWFRENLAVKNVAKVVA